MNTNAPQSSSGSARLLVLGTVAVIIVIGLVLAVIAVAGTQSGGAEPERINVLANSNDDCWRRLALGC